jgi:hypothetical protein
MCLACVCGLNPTPPLYTHAHTQMVAGLRINNSSAWAAFDKMEEKVTKGG